MKRWNCEAKDEIEHPKVDAFLNEIISVCKKHGFSLSHEDFHGAFVVCGFNNDNAERLMYAHYNPFTGE